MPSMSVAAPLQASQKDKADDPERAAVTLVLACSSQLNNYLSTAGSHGLTDWVGVFEYSLARCASVASREAEVH